MNTGQGNNKDTLLTVIIPVYDVEQWLGRCVESVITQEVDGMEVILVDDGSPDGCPTLCDEWARRDTRVRVCHQENRGLSGARNTGIGMAQGRFITFVDSDDMLMPGTYAAVLPLMERADIVEFPFVRRHGTTGEQCVSFTPATFTTMEEYWLRGRAYEHCYAWNKVYRRELFAGGTLFPQGRIFEDVALLPKLLAKAKTVVQTDRGMYCYTANDSGITATAGGDGLRQLLGWHLEVLPRWQDDAYYMHVLDIQTDVWRQTGDDITLPPRKESPWARGLTPTQRVKAALLRIVGINGLCRINKTIRRSS